MKHLILLLITASVMVPPKAEAQGRGNAQGTLVSTLRSGTFDERYAAVHEAIKFSAADKTPQLWRALVNELKRTLAERESKQPEWVPEHLRGDYLGDLLQAVAWCPDADVIDPLIELIDTGAMATETLASFGENAAMRVVKIAGDPTKPSTTISGALLTLQRMHEVPVQAPLSPGSRRAIVQVAGGFVKKGHSNAVILGRAAATAAVTQDPELLRIVEDLAREPGDVAKLGVTAPGQIELVQKLAAEGLASAKARRRPR